MVTKNERMAYGLFFTGQNMIYLFVMNYLQNYFTDVVGIAAGTIALIILAARFWDAVNDPMFGVIVDKCRFKGGRFKPWLRVSAFIVPIVTVLLFCVPQGWPLSVKTAVCAVLYIAWGMCFTVCDVPAHSLSTAMTDDIAERTALIARGRFFSMLGILCVMVLTVPLVGLFTRLFGGAAAAWLATAVLFSAAAFGFMRRLGKAAKERFVNHGEAMSFTAIFRYVRGNKYLLIFFGSLILANLTNTATTLALYFANVNLGNSGLYIPLVVVTMLGSPFVSLLMPRLNKRFDKFKIYMFGLTLTILSSIAAYLIGYEGVRFFPFLAVCAVKGLGASCNLVMCYMFSADCLEYGAYKTGSRPVGVTFSIQTFTTKITGAVSGFLAMGLLGWLFHYQSAYYVAGELVTPVQSAEAARGIWLTFSIFPAFGAAAAFLTLILFYKLRDKDVQIMTDVNSGKISREEGERLLSARKGGAL